MNTDPERVNYNAFQDDVEEVKVKENQGLKLSSERSRFSKQDPKGPSEEEFKKEVREYKQRDMDVKLRIADLTNKYKGILMDRTVDDNKSPIQKDLEASVVSELVQVGLQLDNDQDQPEGVGSIGLCNLLLQVNLLQRNTINKISYDVAVLTQMVTDLTKLVDTVAENGSE